MTTNNAPSGRLQTLRHPARQGKLAVLCGALLCVSAVPALAGPGLAGDSADQMPVADSVTRTLLADPLRVPDRSLMFASDVNQQIVAEAQPPAIVLPKPENRSQTLLKRALGLLGTPYRWGGTSPEGGFDCSGLVGYVFRTALGIELPRVSRDMARDGEQVEKTSLVPGDLVFFSRRGKRIDHVGIYLGEGRFVHAPRTGKDVMVSELDTGYWSHRFMQARRVPGLGS